MEKTTEKKWIVTVGTVETEYSDAWEAEEMCLEKAREKAIEERIDADDIELWFDDETCEFGACPSNDDGAYWPHGKLIK